MKRVLLLDVDGVLDPEFTPRAWAKRSGRDGWRRYDTSGPDLLDDETGEPLRLAQYLNAGHGAMLLAAAAEASAELAWATTWNQLAWATTWNQLANKYVGPRIGLPELPVYNSGGNPKRPAGILAAVAAQGARFAWLDDSRKVIAACQASPHGAGVWVHARSGLMQYHLDRAVKILRGENL
jgi:hypothetical protein